MKKKLLVVFAIAVLCGFAAKSFSVQNQMVGAALPQAVAVFETSLASPISSSATSMTLAANAIRGGGALSGFNCFTVDEGSAQAETICGTVSGTSVTGLTRGISQSTGTTTVSALQFSHRRGANVKITDFPIIQILKAQANGEDTYPNPLTYANGQHPCSVSSASTTICDKNYSDNLIAAGAAAGSNSVAGIFLSSTGLQTASSTATGVYNSITYNYVIPTSVATDTPNTATRGSRVLMSQIGGYLRQSWLDLTEAFTFAKLTTTATTTIPASGVSSNPLVLNSIAYKFPATQSASSTILSTDGAGSLYWTGAPVGSYVGAYVSTTTSDTSGNSYNQDTAYVTSFMPNMITVFYKMTGPNGSGTAKYSVGNATFASTTAVVSNYKNKNNATTDTMLPSEITIDANSPTAGDGGSACQLIISIPSITSTGFTVRIAHTGGGTFGSCAAMFYPIAFR